MAITVTYSDWPNIYSPNGSNQLVCNGTVSAGSDRALLVYVRKTPWDGVISNVKYAGISMTPISSIGYLELFILVNPPVGTANVVAQLGSYFSGMMGCVSLTGVDQTTPVSALVQDGQNTYTSLCTSGSVPADGIFFGVSCHNYSDSAPSVVDGTTLGAFRDGGSGYTVAAAYRTTAGTIGWNHTASNWWETKGVSVNPVASGPTATLSLTTDVAVFAGLASVSPLTVLTAALANAVFSGVAGAGTIASMALTTDVALFSGSASVAGAVALTLPALKNNTGTLLASETGATVYVYQTTGAHVVTKTGQTTNSSGVMVITDAALVASTQYRVVIVLASGAEGMDKVTAA